MSWWQTAKQTWVAKQEAKLQAEFAPRLQALHQTLERERKDVTTLIEQAKDRQVELAKAMPDQLWVTAVATGFRLAFDMMLPLNEEARKRLAETVREEAIDETKATYHRLENGLKAHSSVRSLLELTQKLEEFKHRLNEAVKKPGSEDEKKYAHFVDVLTWVLHADL